MPPSLTTSLDSQTQPNWAVGTRDRVAEAKLSKELGIEPLVAAVLVQRGLSDPEAANAFLNPSIDQLADPATLPDYGLARDAILGARERGELIYVHGDYDVDGVTSAAIFHRFLGCIGCKVHTHVPHRMKEGYGIHEGAVDEAVALGAKLFLTCDCGIAAHDQVDQARAANLSVVVTDHHAIAGELPNADAVVNPHRTDSAYGFSDLSGAGVAFRLCDGLNRELGQTANGYYRAFLDLAALGTIADVMPLVGENRVIAKFGLEQLRQTKKVGLLSLMREANVGQDPARPLLSRHVGWQLGPRLNAVGRIEDAAVALRLLIEQDPAAADELARQLERVNLERRSKTQEIVEEAEEMVLANGYDKKSLIMVANAGWHAGIVGIVAGRLVDKFHRPVFVLTINTESGTCKGSARSIPKFHLAEAIWAHPGLVAGGGHAMAAGCSFPAERLEEVRTAFESYADERLTPEDLRPTISADMEVTWDEVTMRAAEGLNMLEPFGCGNPEPTFVASTVALSQIRPTRNPAHVRLVLRQNAGAPFSGIAFGIGEELSELGAGAEVDLLFKPDINDYKGLRELQWQVKGFRAASR